MIDALYNKEKICSIILKILRHNYKIQDPFLVFVNIV